MARISAVFCSILLLSFALTACGEKGDDDKNGDNGGPGGGGGGPGGGGGGGGGSGPETEALGVVLTSGTLALGTNLTGKNLNVADGDPVNCHMWAFDGVEADGQCATPINLSGWVTQISLGETAGNGVAPARILGARQDHPGQIFTGGRFDFKDADELEGNSTLTEQYEIKTSYDLVNLQMAFWQIQIQVKGKFWTVLIPAYSQPLEENEIVQSCGYDDGYINSEVQESNLIAGMEFERGDYLFCVKDSADVGCEATDFQWFDTETNALVSERPTNPKQTASLADDPGECKTIEGDQYPSLNYGKMSVLAKIAEPFKLYADYSHGSSSVRFPNATSPESSAPAVITDGSPHLDYFYEAAGATAVTGTEMKVSLDFDAKEQVFFDGITDYDGATEEELMAAFKPKQFFITDAMIADGREGTGFDPGLDVTVSVELE